MSVKKLRARNRDDWPENRYSKGHDMVRRPHRAGAQPPCEKCRRSGNLTGTKV